MKLTRVENFLSGKNQVKFGAAEEKTATKPVVDDDDDDEYEDESFWARNKGTFAALGAIGAAGVAIYAIKRGRAKNPSSKVKSLEETAKKLDIYDLQRQFRDELAKASDDKEIGAIIKRAMGHENQELRGNLLSDLVLGSRKYINSESWETLFDAAVAHKPQRNRFSGLGYIDSLVENMNRNEMFTPEILDKMAAKMSESSDEVKVVVAKRLIDGHLKAGNIEYTSLSPEQLKKIMGALEGIKSEKLNVDIGVKREYNVPELLFKYNKKYFNDAPFDENFVTDLKEVLSNPKFSEDMRLQMIQELSGSKFNEVGVDFTAQRKAIRVALDALVDMPSDTYKASYSWMTDLYGEGRKFVLGEKLLSRLTGMSFDEFPAAERLSIIDKLIASAERLQNNGTVDISQRQYRDSFNNLLSGKLTTKRKAFEEQFKQTHSFDGIHDFINDIQADISQMNKDYADWHIGVKSKTKHEYDTILLMISNLINDNKSKFYADGDFTKQTKIWNKINDFGKRTFGSTWRNHYDGSYTGYSGWGYGGYSGKTGGSSGWGGSSSGSAGSSSGSGRSHGSGSYSGFGGLSKVNEAKQTLLKYLRQKEELAELADKVEKQEMDKDLLKTVKRKLSLAYHPDKAGDDKELAAQNTVAFQQISNAIDIIEKKL